MIDSNIPEVEKVEIVGDFVHGRFRDPDRYDEIRTPDWAYSPDESVFEGERDTHRTDRRR